VSEKTVTFSHHLYSVSRVSDEQMKNEIETMTAATVRLTATAARVCLLTNHNRRRKQEATVSGTFCTITGTIFLHFDSYAKSTWRHFSM
jgi:hypothetical protein